MKSFDAVLIDLDGTLTDSEPLWHTAEHELIENYGKVVDLEIQKTFTGVDTPTMIGKLRNAYGIEASEEILYATLSSRIKELLQNVEARAGAAEFLSYLEVRGVPRALVSNSSVEIIETSLMAQPWKDTFKGRFSAEHVENAKPAPDLYLHAANALGATPENCLVLEDSLTGIRAGISAGMTCAAIPSDPDPDFGAFRVLTPHVFETLYDVMDWLEQKENI